MTDVLVWLGLALYYFIGRRVCRWAVNKTGMRMNSLEGILFPLVWPVVWLLVFIKDKNFFCIEPEDKDGTK